MVRQKLLKGTAIFFGSVGLVFMVIALCTNFWLRNGSNSNGLWQVCNETECSSLKIGSNRLYTNYEMVRGFGVLSVILVFIGTVVTIFNIIVREIETSVMATLFLMAAFFTLICASLFTSLSRNASFGWGYSFGLGWAAFPSTLFAGIIMVYIEFKQS